MTAYIFAIIVITIAIIFFIYGKSQKKKELAEKFSSILTEHEEKMQISKDKQDYFNELSKESNEIFKKKIERLKELEQIAKENNYSNQNIFNEDKELLELNSRADTIKEKLDSFYNKK